MSESEPTALSPRDLLKEAEDNLISEILADLVDVTRRGALLWSEAPQESQVAATELREFHYETRTTNSSWALHNDGEGQPVLECFVDSPGAAPLLRITAELYDLEKLLELIRQQWSEVVRDHKIRTGELKTLLGDLRNLPAPDDEEGIVDEDDDEDDDGAAGLPPEGPVESEEACWTPEVDPTQPGAVPAAVEAALTSEERAAKAQEVFFDRCEEVEAEFVEDCKAAEAEVETQAEVTLDSLPGQSFSEELHPSSHASGTMTGRLEGRGKSKPPTKSSSRRRRRKNKTHVLDNSDGKPNP